MFHWPKSIFRWSWCAWLASRGLAAIGFRGSQTGNLLSWAMNFDLTILDWFTGTCTGNHDFYFIWLMVSTHLNNISQLGLWFPIYIYICIYVYIWKNVPNHQSVICSHKKSLKYRGFLWILPWTNPKPVTPISPSSCHCTLTHMPWWCCWMRPSAHISLKITGTSMC